MSVLHVLHELLTSAPARRRPRWRTALATTATAAVAVSGVALVGAPAAQAAQAAFSCDSVYAVSSGTNQITLVNPATGATTGNGSFGSGTINALALPSGGGRYIYGFNRDNNKVVRFDATTETTTSYTTPSNSVYDSVVAGAINPSTGIFYYAASSSGSWTLFAFNTATNTAIGQVGTISGSALQNNGDMAFDSRGNLYLTTNSNSTAAGTLARVTGTLPTTSGSASLGVTGLATTPANSGQYAALAVGSDGNLVIGTGNKVVLRVNATTGAQVSSVSSSVAFADMASCSSPSTGTVNTDLPDGRYASGDQFSVTITGGGINSGNTGTSTGTDSGLQDQDAEQGGAVLTQQGVTYTVKQTASGTTNLANYDIAWKCVQSSNGAVLSSGTGTTGSYTSPASAADVVCTFTDTPKRPSIDLVKTSGSVTDTDANGVDAGDTITYHFKVTNTGPVALSPVTVTDPMFASITCPGGALAAGASTTCGDRTYTLTQADIDAGRVINTATAKGVSPTGDAVTDVDSVNVPLTRSPAIVLDKKAGATVDVNHSGREDAGDTIAYTFKVTNTGNVTLDPVTVTDAKVGTVTCPSGALAPGASITCTAAAYTLTQADVTAGTVVNTALATGTSPNGTKVTDDDTETVTVPQYASIDLVKTAGAVTDTDANGVDPGDTITYGFKVTNTGTVPLSAVTVSDVKVGAVTCPSGALAPGASITCTNRTYALTQADIDAGSVVNTATATGTPPTGTVVTDTDSVTTTVGQTPAVRLDKTAGAVVDANGDGLQSAGDTITYGFKITNTGNVALNPVTVADALVGTVTCPTGALAPGASRTCTSRTYTLTQADVTAGKVVNTAVATGTAPGGAKVTDDDTVTTPVAAAPSIRVDKTAGPVVDANGDGDQSAGDTITYHFVVTNTGNLPLSPVTVADAKVGGVTCPSGSLAPGASLTCTDRTYTLTPADVTAGKVVNTAVATGTTPAGTKVTDDDGVTTTLLPPTNANVAIAKSVDNAHPRPGDTVTYTLKVSSTGDAAAQDVVVSDPVPAGVTVVSASSPCTIQGADVTCALGTLPAGATRTLIVVATVDPVVTGDAAVQHDLDVQKVEAQIDLDPGQTRTVSVQCPTGYLVTDGSGRVDAVDQGTGTLADVHVLASHATDAATWAVTAVNAATGRAQAKAFAVCVQQTTAAAAGHTHQLVESAPVVSTVSLPAGSTTVTLDCDPGSTPIVPGFELDGPATVLSSYPSGTSSWTFVVDNPAGDAGTGTLSVRCLDRRTSTTDGHDHPLSLSTLQQTVTVQPGEVAEFQLTCADDAKGIVAGVDLDPGLVSLGNDPRPKTRAFKLENPTENPLTARLWMLCLAVRTGSGTDDGTVVNTATVATSSTQTVTTDDASSVSLVVDTSPRPAGAAQPAAGFVAVSAKAVTSSRVKCPTTGSACTGTIRLIATRTQRIAGHRVKKGAVLASTHFKVRAGVERTVRLTPTHTGRQVLRSGKLTRAVLKIGKRTRTVRVRH